MVHAKRWMAAFTAIALVGALALFPGDGGRARHGWPAAWGGKAAPLEAGDGEGKGASQTRSQTEQRVRPRLVVSMTTITSRVPHITRTLQSLVNQNLKADAIYIAIPRRPGRNGSAARSWPKSWPSAVTVIEPGESIGSA